MILTFKVCFILDLIFSSLKFINFPKPEAARSLAIPRTPRQSDLFGVIDKSIRLDFNFDKLIEPGDYLLKDAPAPIAAPQIPQSGAVIAPPPRADVIPTTGLTATETALLSPEEQIIRQRTRT